MNTDKLKSIRQCGKKAKGQAELIRHLQGQALTLRQAVQAHCFDCMGYFADGKRDCGMPGCALYPFMPYNPNRTKKVTGRKLTDAHKAKLHAARA